MSCAGEALELHSRNAAVGLRLPRCTRELRGSDGFSIRSCVLYSPVTAVELWAAARAREHEGLSNLFRSLLCVPIDGETGRRAGDYLRDYRKSHSVELGDALIAAKAILNNAELWTRNRKHYPMRDVSFY